MGAEVADNSKPWSLDNSSVPFRLLTSFGGLEPGAMGTMLPLSSHPEIPTCDGEETGARLGQTMGEVVVVKAPENCPDSIGDAPAHLGSVPC